MASAAPLRKSYLRLFDLAKAFNFVKTPASNDMDRTVRDLREVQGSALIIGGIAVAHHGLERLTADVDILYKNQDVNILKRLRKYFKLVKRTSNGWYELKHKSAGVRLKLILESGLGQYGFIPFCDTVGGADGYISLKGLIWLTLVAGRPQDDADIVRLYNLNPSAIDATRCALPAPLQERFDALVLKAKADNESNPLLHPEKFMKRMLPDGTVVDLSGGAGTGGNVMRE